MISLKRFWICFEIMQNARLHGCLVEFACENSLNNSKLAKISWKHIGKKCQLFTVSSVAVHELQLTQKSHSKQASFPAFYWSTQWIHVTDLKIGLEIWFGKSFTIMQNSILHGCLLKFDWISLLKGSLNNSTFVKIE